ncbi:MAG: peptide chain release factor N(5)-glutamine methyltransferase [Holosporaceae bacterium]|nr:peptide chain release factor N(5)-glutamine methyltransferase [Holosporaceae bacterium]
MPSAQSIISDCLKKHKNISIKDLRLIIGAIKNISYEKILFLAEKTILNHEEMSIFFKMLNGYLENTPISKLINKKQFWKHEFFVNFNVLDPRPETELIIEMILKRFDPESKIKFLDLGTGSGCVLLSLLAEFKNSVGTGLDISQKAIDVAVYNKNRLNLENANFINADWNNISSDQKFDVIVTNPPYVKTNDINELDESVRNYDPRISLDGGVDGLKAYREISNLAKKFLAPSGAIFFEIGCDQKKEVEQILCDNGFKIHEIRKDYNGIERVIFATLDICKDF